MSDLAALADLLARDAQMRGQTVSRLGYFCAPFQPTEGPYADKVIKVYRGLRDKELLARLARTHEAYVEALNAADVGLPNTAFHLLPMGALQVPVIVQEALPQDCLMRPLMQSEPVEETLKMMEAAGLVIARFWHWAAGQQGRIGFHPSIRNFAYQEGRARFFDTFPPLIDYDRAEMGRMLLTFSDKRLMRLIGPLMSKRVTGIQDEWYDPAETLVGLVGSACRLRPDDAQAYLDWGNGFARREMAPWADAAIAGMKAPPRLPGYWTGFRKILGLQGEPNLTQKPRK